MERHRLERQLAFLAENPDISVASSLVTYIDEHDAVIGRSRSPFTRREEVARYARENRVFAINHPAAIIRRSVLMEVGGYRPEFVPAEDCDLWGRLVERGYHLLVQPEYLLRYRVYTTSSVGQTVDLTERRLAWVARCAMLRRQGQPEITFAEHEAGLADEPWWRRLNRRRAEVGSALYGRAVFSIARHGYGRAAAQLAGAATLRPGLVLGRIAPRLVPPTLRRPA
jgi:hypothetical protein